jgi:hypothetical protein
MFKLTGEMMEDYDIICAGCDVDGRVCLWITDKDGNRKAPLTNENWPDITKPFGYRVGEMAWVQINTNPKPSA